MSNEAIDAGRHNPEDSQKLPVSRGAEATPALYREGYGYGYGPPPLASEGDLAASFLHYVRIALKRRWLILSVIAAVVVIGTLKALMTTPRYAATVRIQIDREAAKVFESNSSTQQDENTADFLRTQFELLRSRAMAERVVSQLHLYEDADFLKTRKESLIASLAKPFRAPRNETPGELQAQAVKAINSEVDVKPVAGSRLVDITFMDTDPTRAQLIANAYADAF